MKGLRKFSVLLLSLTVVLTACGSGKNEPTNAPASFNNESTTEESAAPASTSTETEKEKEKVEVETTSYKGDGFSLSFPSSWEAAELNIPLIVAAFVDSNPKHGFGDNLNVTVEDSSASAKEAADLTVSQLSSGAGGEGIKDYKKIDYKDHSVSGNKTAGVLKAQYNQPQSGATVILTQYFVSSGTKLYTASITFSEESYKNGGEEMVQKIIDSFQVTETVATSTSTDSNTEKATANTNAADMMSLMLPSLVEGGVINEKTYNYIVNNHKLFPAVTAETKKAASAEVDKAITSRHLFKNINPYLDKMVEVSGYVLEITEEKIDENTTIAEVHILDDNDNSIIGIYFNSTGDILDDDYVTMRGVPTIQYSFENIGGGTTNAVLLTVSTLKKIQ
ncbi:MAG: hypothetical protein ACQEXX_08675 [Bacillota bacterium]